MMFALVDRTPNPWQGYIAPGISGPSRSSFVQSHDDPRTSSSVVSMSEAALALEREYQDRQRPGVDGPPIIMSAADDN
ncbi:MAG TPA: hypothetical protein EYM68_02870 [Gammaproteobacteria bacterium]|nr:hypothetical protein [Gammaproteobacteria bacterium]